jgi:5-methyltetrahydropteroyltriglutamate--homocysteine methyltransferase
MSAHSSPWTCCRGRSEASRYVSVENLSLSPQCGFASVEQGSLLASDDELRKLDLVVNTARLVWGD